MTTTTAEITEFLEGTKFSGYQAVPLPGGLHVPGKDRTRTADLILGSTLEGKSVLDVGTYYGFFPAEAIRRGASRAVGIEADHERYDIARRIAELNGRTYEIHHARVEDLSLGERFDLVLFLNVLHHVTDPVCVMRNLVQHCKGLLIVEFCLADDPQYLYHLSSFRRGKMLRKAAAKMQSVILRTVCRGLPLMAIGNRDGHRTFYFSPEAFRNLFVLHLGWFRGISFLRPPGGRRRMIAVCEVAL
jgi:2-polyprenyl-3-methyl-5-hydroxy-6-metoxy-1,4-benzoquinol methylase